MLLANNEHYDASMAYTDPRFKVMGILKTPRNLTRSEKEIETHFIATNGTPITLEIVEANSKRSPSRAKHKLKKDAPLYFSKSIRLSAL